MSLTELRKMGGGLDMKIQNSILDTVSVRCHVVTVDRQPAAKTGMEGEEMDGEMHDGNQQELVCRAVAL